MKRYYTLISILLTGIISSAQTPTDMEFVPKGSICVGAGYNYDSWNHYWQSDSLIANGNVGTVTHQTIAAGFNVGIIDRLNFIVMVPYMISNTSQGTLNGQDGFSDLSLNLKAKYGEWVLGPGKFKLAGDLGFSTPLSGYLIDFAPLNLGLGTTNLSYRQLISYKLDKGFYGDLRGTYTYRSNIPDVHRGEFYYDQNNAYYSNEVNMYDMLDWSVALGYSNTRILGEVSFTSAYTLGGGDIRTWDPGFPSNKMNWSVIQGRFDYYFKNPKGLNISARVGYTVDGRNVGQSWYENLAVSYIFPVWGKEKNEAKPVQ